MSKTDEWNSCTATTEPTMSRSQMMSQQGQHSAAYQDPRKEAKKAGDKMSFHWSWVGGALEVCTVLFYKT